MLNLTLCLTVKVNTGAAVQRDCGVSILGHNQPAMVQSNLVYFEQGGWTILSPGERSNLSLPVILWKKL